MNSNGFVISIFLNILYKTSVTKPTSSGLLYGLKSCNVSKYEAELWGKNSCLIMGPSVYVWDRDRHRAREQETNFYTVLT